MNIIICHAQVPFVRGGAELHVEGLRDALIKEGHQAEIVALPFKWYPQESLLKSALAWRLVDVTESNGIPVDLVICTKFPTWAVSHPRKLAWVIHQYRQAYDWFGTEMSNLTGSPEDSHFRQQIFEIDRRGLGECHTVFSNSANTAGRLKRFNGIDAQPLLVPIQLNGLAPENSEDYIFTVSRLDRAKRLDLLIRAVAESTILLNVRIAGDGPERESLERLIHDLRLSERIRMLGRIDEGELVRQYNSCRAVYYGPYDEDFGLITVEAFTAGKPVITTPDSGGVLELVEHGVNGLIAEDTTPGAIARMLDLSINDPARAQAMGLEGRERIEGITWPSVVQTLLAGAT